jgi:hypothetical protein
MYVLKDHNPSVCGYLDSSWDWMPGEDYAEETIANELAKYLWENKSLRNEFPITVLIWKMYNDEIHGEIPKECIGTFKLNVKYKPIFKALKKE